jgi:hypothetical protein
MENKTGKYFKYAVGEILLVVIGILIALGINNWNELKKASKKETYLLQEMLKEFELDSIELQNFVRLTNNKVEKGKLIKEYLKGVKLGNDTIFTHLFFNGKTLIFKSFTPTYDEIVSSGQLNIIKNDSLKSLIKDFKEYEEGNDSFLFNDILEIKKNYNFHLYQYFDHENMSMLWEWTRIRDSINPLDYTVGLKKDFEGFYQDKSSYYHVSNAIGADSELHRAYSQIFIPKITRVLASLRKEINSD